MCCNSAKVLYTKTAVDDGNDDHVSIDNNENDYNNCFNTVLFEGLQGRNGKPLPVHALAPQPAQQEGHSVWKHARNLQLPQQVGHNSK